jgi:hypothetical protein
MGAMADCYDVYDRHWRSHVDVHAVEQTLHRWMGPDLQGIVGGGLVGCVGVVDSTTRATSAAVACVGHAGGGGGTCHVSYTCLGCR